MYLTYWCDHLALTWFIMHLARSDPGIGPLGECVVPALYIFIGVVRGAIINPAYGVFGVSFGVDLTIDSRD